jgi:hypothetical protein
VEDQLLANEAKDSTTSNRELQNLHDVKKRGRFSKHIVTNAKE